MRFYELNDTAKITAICEVLQHYDYNEIRDMVDNGTLLDNVVNFYCSVNLRGYVFPHEDDGFDEVFYLDDELRKLICERDTENVDYIGICIENALHYTADKGLAFSSVDNMANYLRGNKVAFDSDGKILLLD